MKKVLTKLKSNTKKIVAAFAVIATILGIAGYVSVNAGEAPEHHKSVSDNHDGTYKIALDITGKADTTSTAAKANILVIFDVSGSMTANTVFNYTATTSVNGTVYGLVSGDYVQLTNRTWYYLDDDGNKVSYTDTYKYAVSTNDNDNNPRKYGYYDNKIDRVYWNNRAFRLTDSSSGTIYDGTVYTRSNATDDLTSNTTYYALANNKVVELHSGFLYNNELYTGTMYTRSSSNVTRADAAEKVVYDFADALFRYNEGEGNSNNVQVSLVTFSSYNHCTGGAGSCTAYPGNKDTAAWVETTDSEGNYWTTNKNDVLNKLSSTGNSNSRKLTYGGGTNWEAAMQKALDVLATADEDPTYVVFVTDGAPTYYVTGGNGRDTDSAEYTSADEEVRNIYNYNTATHSYSDPTKRNTDIYGIYAFGSDATSSSNIKDFLDDVIYYAHNGQARPASEGGVTAATVKTPGYYKANDNASLKAAINDIFEAIVKTLGVGNATITDGTTTNVQASASDINYKLLTVDTESYEYWLSMDVTGSNGTYTMERVNLATAEPYTLTITKKNSSCTDELCEYNVTWEGHEEPVTVLGSVQNGKFKYKWTESNDLYKFNPPTATLNSDGEVIWDLKPLDRLLNGVTYTVTFDVWPSQYTLDLIADIRNGLTNYSTLDENIKKYLKCNAANVCTLYTNTQAKVTYDDTRDNTTGNVEYTDLLDPVATDASEMQIEKLWNNIFGDYSENEYAESGVTFKVIKDGDKDNPYQTIILKPDSNGKWLKNESISAGVIQTKNGKALIRETGHDYTFAETPAELDYHWDLVVETVRPMIIDGTLTTLVKVEENAPEIGETNFLVDSATGTTYYKIDGKVYYVREKESAKMYAANVRRSHLDLTKEVTGEGPADSLFTFELTVNDVNKENLWFSIKNENKRTVKDDSYVTIDNESENLVQKETDDNGNFNGYYEIKSGTKLTIKLKKDWNIRFTNIPIGSTYTFEETAMPENFVYDMVAGSKATIQTTVLPVGAVSNGDGTYTYTKADGKKVVYTEIKNSNNEVTGYKYDAEVTSEASNVSEKISGVIYTGNTIYNVKYTNEYELTNVTVNKSWSDNDNQDGKRPEGGIVLKLYQNGTELEDKEVTLTDANAVVNEDGTTDANTWTYTWEELPKFNPNDNNKEYEYTVTEEAVTDYETTYDDKVSVELIAKPTDQAEEIAVTLLANGEATDKTATLNADNNFKATITDLDYLDEDGKMITYTVSTESSTPVKLYTKDKTIEITNEHEPEKIDVPVEKVWDDADDQDGARPTSVTFNLLVGEDEIDEYTLTVADAKVLEDGTKDTNTWTYTFEDLDKYSEGEEIEYTISEDPIVKEKKYTATPSSRTEEDGTKVLIITNSRTPEETEVSGTKTWDHKGNTRIAPASITIHLFADGTELTDKALTLTSASAQVNEDGTTNANVWEYSFTGLPKYRDGGTEIAYTTSESDVPGYISEKTGNNFKNTLDVIDIPVKKVWNDADDQDGQRPDSVTFNLLADGTEVAEYTLTTKDVAGNQNTWAYTFPNQNKYDSEGNEITYTVTENAIDTERRYNAPVPSEERDSTTGVVTYVITNTHVPEETEVNGTKTWNHMGNTRIAPASITIHLFADGTELTDKALTVTSANVLVNEDGSTNENVWTFSFTGLPKYNNGGTEIVYTVDETLVPGYKKTQEGNNITNTLDVVNVPVEKVWSDANDQDGKRPDSVTFNLLANGTKVAEHTLTANDKTDDNTWAYTFPNQNKYDSEGVEITYTISEDAIDAAKKYTPSNSDRTTEDGTKILGITNTHTPEVTEVSGTKTWDHKGNTRIAPASITIHLYADGTELIEKALTISANNAQVNEDGSTNENVWEYSFTDLPKYRDGGTEIVYTTSESEVPGYISEQSGYNFTNTLDVVNIPVEKVWDDANNQDGARPDSVTFNLLANDTKVAEYTLTANDKVDDNTWAYTFPNQNKYDSEGNEITYTISETAIDAAKKYTAIPSTRENEDGTTVLVITNTRATEETEVSGTKTWNHMGNTRIAPASITIHLYADGTELTDKALTISAANAQVNEDGTTNENVWEYSFTGLPKYKNGGTKIVYTTSESEVPGYISEQSGYNFTNTLDVVNIPVEKIWNDANNQDGTRPDSVTFYLLANGSQVAEHTLTADDKEAGNDNKWVYTFPNQNKFDSEGNEITYTISEKAIDEEREYTPAYAERTENDVTIHMVTNTHKPGETAVEITKVWDDASDQDGVRPTTITVRLYADDVEVKEEKVDLTVANAKVNEDGTTDTDTWVYTISGLPKYKDGGTAIVYTITEDDFEANVAAEDKKYTSKVEGYTITNSHRPEETSITITKVWDDNSNQDGKRPETITINLLADGASIGSYPVSGSGDEWTYTIDGLPKYKDGGTEIEYTITEDAIEASRKYTSKVEGYKVTNKHIPETTEVVGKKVWRDDEDLEGYRPTSVTVHLFADGIELEDKALQVTAETAIQNEDGTINNNEWAYKFENLPKYKNGGTPIAYTVSEDKVANYDDPAYDDQNPYIIINTHQTTELEVVVNKKWTETSAEGIVDEFGHVRSVDVRLEGKVGDKEYYNHTETITPVVDEETGEEVWTYTFKNLPQYRDGQDVVYTAYEVTNVKEYSIDVDFNHETNIVNISNIYTPGKTDIYGEKTWDDADNQDGLRPDSITVVLLANDEEFRRTEVKPTTVTNEDGEEVEKWLYEFTNLPKQHDGTDIIYTLQEVTVGGYQTITDGYNITNTHTPETVSFTVNKIWDDNNNNDGLRPDSITVNLKADGTIIDPRVVTPVIVTNEDGEEVEEWSCAFTDLPKYRDGGIPIVYTIEEENVKSYDTNIEFNEETNEYQITNSHEDETVDIEITKVWDDVNDAAMMRPEEIEVDITVDGVVIDTITINAAEDGWYKKITGLPKYADGEEIVYDIVEHAITEYDTSYAGTYKDGFVITNKHELGKGNGEDPELPPPQTSVDIEPISNTNNKTFIYVILILLNILGINIAFVKNN